MVILRLAEGWGAGELLLKCCVGEEGPWPEQLDRGKGEVGLQETHSAHDKGAEMPGKCNSRGSRRGALGSRPPHKPCEGGFLYRIWPQWSPRQ